MCMCMHVTQNKNLSLCMWGGASYYAVAGLVLLAVALYELWPRSSGSSTNTQTVCRPGEGKRTCVHVHVWTTTTRVWTWTSSNKLVYVFPPNPERLGLELSHSDDEE